MQAELSRYQELRDWLRRKKYSDELFFKLLRRLQTRKNVIARKILNQFDLLRFKGLRFLNLSPSLSRRLPLNLYTAKLHYSHQGEDGIIQEIFRRLHTDIGCFVEFGATDGISASNTFGLLLKNWRGVYIEGNPKFFEILHENYPEGGNFKCIRNIDRTLIPLNSEALRLLRVNAPKNVKCIQAFISLSPRETLDEVLSQTDLPCEIDFMSIDIDSNDYWIWKSLTNYQPKVTMVEYNPSFHPHESKTIAYDREHQSNGTVHFGASASAFYKLGKQKGYTLVANTYSSLFFIRNDLMSGSFKSLDVGSICKVSSGTPTQKSFLDV